MVSVCVSVSACVCIVHVLTFKGLDLETSLLVCTYLAHVCTPRSSHQSQGHRTKKTIHPFVSDLRSVERQSCFSTFSQLSI